MKQAKDSFIKTLESRLVLYGPNDPQTAACYESLGDVAVAEENVTEAMTQFDKSLSILSECKVKLDSSNYYLHHKKSNNSYNNDNDDNEAEKAKHDDYLRKQPSFLILDVAQKRVEYKVKHIDINMRRSKAYKEKRDRSKREQEHEGTTIAATAESSNTITARSNCNTNNDNSNTDKVSVERNDTIIYELHKELRRKEVLSKIAVGMKEKLNEAVKEKQFVIDSLREQLEDRARSSVAMVEECESLRGKLVVMKKYVESKDEELIDKNETIAYLMSTLEIIKKKWYVTNKK